MEGGEEGGEGGRREGEGWQQCAAQFFWGGEGGGREEGGSNVRRRFFWGGAGGREEGARKDCPDCRFPGLTGGVPQPKPQPVMERPVLLTWAAHTTGKLVQLMPRPMRLSHA